MNHQRNDSRITVIRLAWQRTTGLHGVTECACGLQGGGSPDINEQHLGGAGTAKYNGALPTNFVLIACIPVPGRHGKGVVTRPCNIKRRTCPVAQQLAGPAISRRHANRWLVRDHLATRCDFYRRIRRFWIFVVQIELALLEK